MSVRAIAADNEVCVNADNVVTSALAATVTLWLQVIGGAGVADDFNVAVYANSTGAIYVKDANGRLVGRVMSGECKLFNADVASGYWRVFELEDTIQLKAAQEVAVGGGAAIAFGATTPGAIATPATVNRFVKIALSDGTAAYIPCWK